MADERVQDGLVDKGKHIPTEFVIGIPLDKHILSEFSQLRRQSGEQFQMDRGLTSVRRCLATSVHLL